MTPGERRGLTCAAVKCPALHLLELLEQLLCILSSPRTEGVCGRVRGAWRIQPSTDRGNSALREGKAQVNVQEMIWYSSHEFRGCPNSGILHLNSYIPCAGHVQPGSRGLGTRLWGQRKVGPRWAPGSRGHGWYGGHLRRRN